MSDYKTLMIDFINNGWHRMMEFNMYLELRGACL